MLKIVCFLACIAGTLSQTAPSTPIPLAQAVVLFESLNTAYTYIFQNPTSASKVVSDASHVLSAFATKAGGCGQHNSDNELQGDFRIFFCNFQNIVPNGNKDLAAVAGDIKAKNFPLWNSRGKLSTSNPITALFDIILRLLSRALGSGRN